MASLVHVPCRLCGADAPIPRYAGPQDAGPPLGRLEVRLVECARCGFVQTDPRPAPDDLAAHYREAEHASGSVYREVGPGSRHAQLSERRARFLTESLGRTRAPGRLLEIGCGRGDLLARIDLAGWDVDGLEPSPAAAAVARAAGVVVHEERLERAELPDGAYDAVLAVSVLEHLDDPGAAADRLERLLAPGGVVCVEVPDTCRPVAQAGEFFGFEHLSHFTPWTLAELFARRGLTAARLERDREHSGLRMAFARGATSAVPLADDRAEARAAIAAYAREREELTRALRADLGARIERWRARKTRVGVYGAGAHTRFLCDLVPLREVAACVLDGDREKQGRTFLGLPVRAPEQADELALGAVVLSSKAFQEEMARRLSAFAARGGEVVRLYP